VKSKKFEKLVEALETLPTIGKKSALRLAYHMVLESPMAALRLAHAIEEAVSHVHRCAQCGGLSEDELCGICSDPSRESSTLLLVQSAKDIQVIEESGEYHGLYFVFEALEQRRLEELRELILQKEIEELIFAFTPSIQNDALILFIEDRLQDLDLLFTKIAQGVPTGVHLENVDTLSLAKAISDRVKV